MLENIAHQWRQPLSQINSSILVIDEILSESNFNNLEVNTKLNEIETMTKYMSHTIDDFKNFVSVDKTKTKFNIIKTIEKSIEIVDAAFIYENIDLILKYNKENIIYKGFPNNLQQVLLVVLNNAKDAFNLRKIKKGVVVIEVTKINKECIISISDNTGGIDEKIKDKIFEPYFTTKHPNVGTGLGLYISRKLLEKTMNGSIKVVNRNQSANFIITLKEEDEK
ncbi:hypothetical protein GCM10012288_24230 [Malaciobacter pacificus]|uniref:sensor histidine kinase n=1 Tax=Malaciobacter pacificus TaxID=1080223 RepID=UPI001029885E|nr:HAMP domain-containing sensor histidine kinase [Malaciobacter pacificus]GGD49312.1 hypothetical protein GCM10012288_24230 [Malaciobacter pacificus]